MKKDIFRKELADFRPYIQGKPIEEVAREYGIDRIEKLASNECQFGPSRKAVTAMKAELDLVHFYPEGYPYELIKKLAKRLDVKAENLAVGNGGEGVIWSVAMAFLNEGDEVITMDPSFDIYSVSAALMGAKTIKVPLKDDDFDIDGMIECISAKTKLIYLCTPNNPTGNMASKEDIDRLIKALPDHAVLILDEAYYEFAIKFDGYPDDNIDYLNDMDNLIIIRTFSKVYGIAGIRIGYAVTSPVISEKLNMVRQTFGVNRIAQAGALAALDDDEYVDEVTTRNKEALEYLQAYFDAKLWDYIPSYTNFIWVNMDQDSKLIFEALQQRGVIVRAGFLWGWPTWVRISTGTMDQMEFFTEQMDEVLLEIKE